MLDVASNRIKKIENVSHLTELQEFWVSGMTAGIGSASAEVAPPSVALSACGAPAPGASYAVRWGALSQSLLLAVCAGITQERNSGPTSSQTHRRGL